jgi:hypothetical protein
MLSLAVYMTKVQRSRTVWELPIMRYKNINSLALCAKLAITRITAFCFLFINITLEKCDKTKNTLHLLYIYAHRERILLTLYSTVKKQS